MEGSLAIVFNHRNRGNSLKQTAQEALKHTALEARLSALPIALSLLQQKKESALGGPLQRLSFGQPPSFLWVPSFTSDCAAWLQNLGFVLCSFF